MARTTVDVTYATKDGSEPRTPGRPVVHPASDRNPSQPQATPVAMRVDTFNEEPFKGSDGKEYLHIRAFYLHAQETDEKEPQPYVALTNRPKYDGNHLLVRDGAGKTVYTNEMICSMDDYNAMAAAACHAQENEPSSKDVRRVRTENGAVLTSLYIQAPMEFATDNLAPANRNNGRKPTYLRPIAHRAQSITEATIPDAKFWTEVDGEKVLNLDAVDSFQAERSKELQPQRELIRANRGKEIISKLTGKPFGSDTPKTEEPAAEAHEGPVKATGLGKLFTAYGVKEYEPKPAAEAPAMTRDEYAASLTPEAPAAEAPSVENEGPSI